MDWHIRVGPERPKEMLRSSLGQWRSSLGLRLMYLARGAVVCLLAGCGDPGGSEKPLDDTPAHTDLPVESHDSSDALPEVSDVDLTEVDGVGWCWLDEYRDRFLIKNPDSVSDSQIWMAILSSGFLTGRNVEGERSSFDCFEPRWRVVACEDDAVTLELKPRCDEDGTRTVEIVRGPPSDLGLATLLIEGLTFERWGTADPSTLDKSCERYVCAMLPFFPEPAR